MQRLKDGKKVDVPIYNFVTHRREERTVSMYGANVLIFEGILSFHNKQVVGTMTKIVLGQHRVQRFAFLIHNLQNWLSTEQRKVVP